MSSQNYELVDMEALDRTPCPCGFSRRAFADDPASPASFHIVDIEEDSKTHYHKTLTEIYFVLEGNGHIEVDGETLPLAPGSAVLIKPGCRHRAVGKLRIINMVTPRFDPEDEWFD
ncbi:MAG: cupin domain-containing protein [Planctomycetota bacterium]